MLTVGDTLDPVSRVRLADAWVRYAGALTRAMPSAELFARQRTVGLVGRISSEILGMAIVVVRHPR